MIERIQKTIEIIENSEQISAKLINDARKLSDLESHVILWHGLNSICMLLCDDITETKIHIYREIDEDTAVVDNLLFKIDDQECKELNINIIAAFYYISGQFREEELSEGIKYTKEGMMSRVMEERIIKSLNANYKLKLSNNLYGEHILKTDKGQTYRITLRDFEKKTGYIDNIDWRTNKLGTTKHIMYVFNYLEKNPSLTAKMDKSYPFIDICTDPLNDYRISWYFPNDLSTSEKKLLDEYFGEKGYISDNKLLFFYSFLNKSREFERIKIRQEVLDKIEEYFDYIELEKLKKETDLDYSDINAELYPYQKEGIEFGVFKKSVIIADDMGLGKTLQAISIAIFKRLVFGFQKTLVICPASVKYQWKNEINKFSDEEAIVVEGSPQVRKETYINDTSFFHIINYETVLRDFEALNTANYDFIILDEAQKIKNYETKTANAVKYITKKHGLVITGTPLENRLLDLYSVVQFLDPYFLAPQWEFSYQHCIFDSIHKNKIHGYYNLQNLKNRLNSILIRREKRDVFDQLPNIVQQDIFVKFTTKQANMHSSFSRNISRILRKKYKTAFDYQNITRLLTNMRMVCDSTYLIDNETNESPKLDELREMLVDNFDIKNSDRKIIIFSEWVTMLKLIAEMLLQENITYAMLSGKVPVKKRNSLIKEFETNPECKIFLSSETGGAGLNLQMADTVINFEIPWNPAKKNQRIGRIDRIGQKKKKLHVYNFLTINSIEIKIATGLVLKQNLFDGILKAKDKTDEVDFSQKGKSQFIKQLEELFDENGFISDIPETDKSIEEPELQILEFESDIEIEADSISDTSEPVTIHDKPTVKQGKKPDQIQIDKFEKIEEVMTKGMEFLTGLYQMSSGEEIKNTEKPKVNVNRETGEITLTFKMDF